MYENLQGRVAVVTGASRGLGRELCKYLCGHGVKVAAIARGKESLEKLKDEIGKHSDIMIFPSSVIDYDAMEEAVKKTINKWGKIDILINNAGVINTAPLEELTKEMIDGELDTIIKGMIYITKHAAPYMMKEKSGCIINITSTSALRGLNSNGVYYAAKHAQKGFADSMSKYLAPHNIHVVTICPGGMNTSFWDKESLPQSTKDNFMKAEEIADLIGFILCGSKNTLYKQVTLFPIAEAELW